MTVSNKQDNTNINVKTDDGIHKRYCDVVEHCVTSIIKDGITPDNRGDALAHLASMMEPYMKMCRHGSFGIQGLKKTLKDKGYYNSHHIYAIGAVCDQLGWFYPERPNITGDAEKYIYNGIWPDITQKNEIDIMQAQQHATLVNAIRDAAEKLPIDSLKRIILLIQAETEYKKMCSGEVAKHERYQSIIDNLYMSLYNT